METLNTFPISDPALENLCNELDKFLLPLESIQNNNFSRQTISDLKYSRKNYVKFHMLYQIINHCVSKELSNKKDDRASKLLEDVSEALALAELPHYVRLPLLGGDQLKNSCVLEVNVESIVERAEKLLTTAHRRTLGLVMGSYIQEQCFGIVSFIFPHNSFDTPAKGMEAVNDHVSKIKEETHSKTLSLVKQQSYNGALMTLVFDQAMEYGQALQDLIEEHRFSDYPYLHLKQLSISMETYYLKLKCLKLDLMSTSYTKDTIPALQKINTKITEQIANTKLSLQQIKLKLADYENCDTKYHDLLREYSSLMRDINFLSAPK